MDKFRIIPTLLIEDCALVKGTQFKHHRYIGDPLNAVSIFNEKEVDEITILDRSAFKKGINFELIEAIATQAFIPLCYGGGIKSVEDAGKLLQLGVEKVILNSATFERPDLIEQIASKFGSSSTVASIDAKTSLLGHTKVWCRNATQKTGIDVVSHAKKMENKGAGEVLLTSINHEGTMQGYNLALITKVSSVLGIPLIAGGGAGNMHHLREAIAHGASAVSIGSMCVFWGRHKAVLINYPKNKAVL